MARKNKATDVFKKIDMKGGDTTVCWEWTGPVNAKGRPYFDLNGQKVLAYRLTYELMTGDVLGDRMARHNCDNEICCNPHHITPGTHDENMKDMTDRERTGLPHGTVKAIKRLIAKNEDTMQEIADKFGVSRTLISEIKQGRVYKHVILDDAPEGWTAV
jgi:hypothetical protein